MKIRVFFKTPDAVGDALDDIFDGEYDEKDGPEEIAVENEELQRSAAENLLAKFIYDGESITVEFDTETGTATVVQVR